MYYRFSGRSISVMPGPRVHIGHVRMALQSQIFREWRDGFQSPEMVRRITIHSVDFRGRPSADSVLLIHLKVDIGGPFPWVVELTGGASVILPILHCGVPYVLFVEQRRVPAGREVLEIPAGKLDGDTYRATAVREIQEELGIVVRDDELVDLTEMLGGHDASELFASPGLGDERVRIFLFERHVSQQELDDLNGRHAGLVEEGESIVLRVLPLHEVARRSRDMKTFAALYLFELYQARSKE